MASSSINSAADLLNTQRLQLPALRSFDDFTARFQLPNYKDLDKWGNRVVKNLLYYQTNYFLLFICVYLIMLMINPMKIFCGLFVQALLIAVVLFAFDLKSSSSSSSSAKSFIASRANKTTAANNSVQQQYKWYILAGTILFTYVLLYWFEALLFSSFALLLPVSLTFIHSSLRLRNIKNKISNTMENIVPSNTPMSAFLDAFNITVDGILN